MVMTHSDGRERLLEVGADLFHDRGYAETTLRDIAQQAGMKAGSIYYHFASKDELLAEVLRLGMAAITEAFVAADAEARQGQAETRLRAAISAHMEALFRHGPFTTAHVSVLGRAPQAVRDQIVPLRDAYEALWTQLLSELRDNGAIRASLDVHFVRLTLLGAMNLSLEWFDPTGEHSLETLIDQLVDQFWGGLAHTDVTREKQR